MSTVNELFKLTPEDIKMFLFVLVLLIFLVPSIKEQLGKMMKALGLVSARVIKKNEYETRMDKIETDIQQLSNEVKELNQGIKDLTTMLSDHIEKYRKNNVAILRNDLWTICHNASERGYITEEELKTFMEEGKVYEESGGDDIYHDKLLPTIKALEMR